MVLSVTFVSDSSKRKIFLMAPYHYDYSRLDQFLKHEYDPKELGNQLDEIMSDLVHLSKEEDDFGRTLSDHHYTLRKLRDIFWCATLKTVSDGDQRN